MKRILDLLPFAVIFCAGAFRLIRVKGNSRRQEGESTAGVERGPAQRSAFTLPADTLDVFPSLLSFYPSSIKITPHYGGLM